MHNFIKRLLPGRRWGRWLVLWLVLSSGSVQGQGGIPTIDPAAIAQLLASYKQQLTDYWNQIQQLNTQTQQYQQMLRDFKLMVDQYKILENQVRGLKNILSSEELAEIARQLRFQHTGEQQVLFGGSGSSADITTRVDDFMREQGGEIEDPEDVEKKMTDIVSDPWVLKNKSINIKKAKTRAKDESKALAEGDKELKNRIKQAAKLREKLDLGDQTELQTLHNLTLINHLLLQEMQVSNVNFNRVWFARNKSQAQSVALREAARKARTDELIREHKQQRGPETFRWDQVKYHR